jgi:hypothetical protein
MNYVTLDYYIAGESKINRASFRKQLFIYKPIKYTGIPIYKIRDALCELEESKLKILLKNWCGYSSLIKGSYSLHISAEKKLPSDLFFSTCSMTLTVHQSHVSDQKSFSNLLDLMTQPINSIRD